MLITALVPKGKTKTRVEIDYDKTLVLSNKDVISYDFREGREIPDEVYEEIVKSLRSDVIMKAGKLLQGMDYPKAALIRKLEQNGYPSDIAEYAADRMEEAHYIDDRRYAENYIKYHLRDKSRSRIKMDLAAKGLSGAFINEVFEEFQSENEEGEDLLRKGELEQIHKLLVRKHYDSEGMAFEDVMKIKAFLMRKGFSSELVRTAMDEFENFEE